MSMVVDTKARAVWMCLPLEAGVSNNADFHHLLHSCCPETLNPKPYETLDPGWNPKP